MNDFYNYSGSFIPGTQGRAEAVAAEFTMVQSAFAMLSTKGTDSGAPNAYVVTTNGAPTGSYTDGLWITFKALASNTGAATINVNSIGAVPILRYTGVAAQSGDITANAWYTLTYNSTYTGFTLGEVVPTTAFPGTISNAAPTHKVGLTANGGVATAALPIDATFAIDQAIIPTWTGAHIFGAGVQLGTPTGGNTGVGTLNAASGLFVNNKLVPNIGSSPTWTGAHTFGATNITGNTVSVNSPAAAAAISFMGAHATMRVNVYESTSSYTGILGMDDTGVYLQTDSATRSFRALLNGAQVFAVDAAGGTTIGKDGASNLAIHCVATTSAPVAGGAGALPANPTGYLIITINGVASKIAYY